MKRPSCDTKTDVQKAVHPYPLPTILRLLSDIAAAPLETDTAILTAHLAGCSTGLLKRSPAEIGQYILTHDDAASALLLLAKMTGYLTEEVMSAIPDFTCLRTAKRHFLRHFVLLPDERLTAVPLDEKGCLTGDPFLTGSHSSSASYTPYRDIVRFAAASGAKQIIIAHNHPGMKAEPSERDIASTKRLSNALGNYGIALTDHFIVSDVEAFSMRLSSEYGYLFGNERFYRYSF